jgi:hypothetical protein
MKKSRVLLAALVVLSLAAVGSEGGASGWLPDTGGGKWTESKFSGSVESETSKATTVYEEPSYSSKPLSELAENTPVLLDAARLYETGESRIVDAWWHTTEPIGGWVASDDVWLWYSGFLTGD